MQIFEINKKNTDVLVFSGITIISKEKALRSRVVKETTFFFINNGDVGTNTPLQKHHFRLGQSGRIVILKKNKSLNSRTHYLESFITKGRLITFQFFAMPPDITNAGLDPLSAAPSRIALVNPAL